jgi:hypothetical protein
MGTISGKIKIYIQRSKIHSLSFSTMGAFIGGVFSIYTSILCLVLCRQQIYVLKSLLALIITQLLLLLITLILGRFATAVSYGFHCERTHYHSEQSIKECENARILAIVAIIMYLLLLAASIFNLVITIREWRARRQAGDDSNNSYLLTNIPLLLGGTFRKTGIAYIVLGLLIVGLDVGFLLNGYLFRYVDISQRRHRYFPDH